MGKWSWVLGLPRTAAPKESTPSEECPNRGKVPEEAYIGRRPFGWKRWGTDYDEGIAYCDACGWQKFFHPWTGESPPRHP